jgi:hypothetical protein
MTEDEKKALLLAGKMAAEVRLLVGGGDMFGWHHEPCTIENLGPRVGAVRNALDAYDDHILQMTRSKNASR